MTADLSRLSLNTATLGSVGLREAANACVEAGIGWIGPWREEIEELGLEESARIVREMGLGVSSLCRGGMFPAETEPRRLARLDDNRRALEEASALGTKVLVLVCGSAPDRDIDGAREQIERGITELAPYAEETHVTLAIEPLHPAFAGDRSAIVTLGEALDIAERIDSSRVGVVVDVYHVWWDPRLYEDIERAAGRIAGFHVNDWPRKVGDPLISRGLMGDGVIELQRMRQAVEKAGYDGPVEVEIFNEGLWNHSTARVLELVKERYVECVQAG